MITFQYWTLLLPSLIIWGFAAVFVWQNQTALQKRLMTVGELQLFPKFARQTSRLSPRMYALIWIVDFAFMAVTAAGPAYPYGKAWVLEGSRQVMIAYDTSLSIAEDFRASMQKWDEQQKKMVSAEEVLGEAGSRLDKAKELTETEILPALKLNQVGLINYQGLNKGNDNALVRMYLSHDFEAIHTMLADSSVKGWNWIDVEKAAADDGSDIATAMMAACNAFDLATPGREKDLVIMGDGGDDSTPEEMAKAIAACKKRNIHIIFVGLGSESDQHLPDYDKSANKAKPPPMKAWENYKGPVDKENNLLTALDMPHLEKLARMCGGRAIKVIPGKPLGIDWAFTIAGSHAVQQAYPLAPYTGTFAILLTAYLWCRAGCYGFFKHRQRKTRNSPTDQAPRQASPL